MKNEAKFIQNTRAIRSALNLSKDEYLASFGMTSQDAERHLMNPMDFPLKFAMNFSEFYNLDLEVLFSEHFDIRAFTQNHLKGEPILPDHYQNESNSRVITLINIVKGITNAGLDWLNDLIFRRMQIPKAILLFPEMPISFKLIVDYLNLVEKYKTNLEVMRGCGQEGINNLNTKFRFIASGNCLNKYFYDEFFSEKIKTFDKSYEYKILSLKGEELVLQCQLKEEAQDLFHTKTLSNLALLNYKCGIASGIATLFGEEATEVIILQTGEKDGVDQLLIKLPRQTSFYQNHLN